MSECCHSALAFFQFATEEDEKLFVPEFPQTPFVHIALEVNKEQQAEIENFRKSAAETRRDLKEVRKNLREDTDRLEFWTKVMNIGLVPLLVALAGLVVAVAHRRRVRARAS